jgi:hypothetical protein
VSSFCDLGTWSFHGTGFTATPFVVAYDSSAFGNTSYAYRGARALDTTLPLLSAPGVAALGVLLAGGALMALRASPRPER